MQFALVHDWLMTMAGAEKVLESIYKQYPAPIYTLFRDKRNVVNSVFKNAEIITSWIQKITWAKKKYRSYLPLFPLAIESFDLSSYDVILSSSHAVAKGVLVHGNQLHICYCHTPMRYLWDMTYQYLKEANLNKGVKGAIAKCFLHYLRMWDITSLNRVNYFIANSNYIAKRIKNVYNRDSVVIYPPVNVELFSVCEQKSDFYLTASRLVPYKKIDLIVEAFAYMPEKRLVVIGDGPDFVKIKRKAAGNVEILGFQPFDVLKEHMQQAKGFVFAADEDFGIISVEAQACGTPVIAYGKGGSLETVVDGKTGVFFDKQSIASIRQGIEKFEKIYDQFDPNTIRMHAEKFSKKRFEKEFFCFVQNKVKEFFSWV